MWNFHYSTHVLLLSLVILSPSFSFFSLPLSPCHTGKTSALEESTAVYLLVKHEFPPAKWKDLAVGLMQAKAIQSIEADSGDAISQLVALIDHWMANDHKKSWEKLVDAVKMSKEKIIAEKLAKDVGVPYQGAYVYF